ncbi:amino acid/amide ABC transporter ATP-binding protein 2, HAAT family (TC 3.A.1.4.-) [Tessaracoccus bendigoensis DSM 12906]|uniref:Amino acid/amide ABC transporter ATP-binding protein 2, HAAT family (TC 3.A.1.4.-) n=1 Tax=Tessaracoccus bendigoensis DSM 12906 TaxID=1123357 RepID=A0A1M6F1F0_9ACTN|nr:ABC transporter ATP-binding protein [Tessaracoccus bendigoensis]SHI91495.1 amino acid/amide ABC transporter ATP-binding protein 2, HAAT family (TC 3.A.1.4.-) [Tessaracoccus bendigoensis DSM 12906]
MLEVRDLAVHFGVINAIKSISFEVNEGEIVTLIGANGAGKTTTLRALSGLKTPSAGTITLEGRDITALSAQDRVRRGMSHVPEGRRIFPDMTVLENLELGAFLRKDVVAGDYDEVYQRFPILSERRRQLAGTLSGGEQQMLAMGRALMAKPKVLLLDEPSMGLAPLLVQEIFDIIVSINKAGTTVLLVEQNANIALQIANRAYVLETGSVVLSGPASELAETEEVRRAYLGG